MPGLSDQWLAKIVAFLYQERRSTRYEVAAATKLNIGSVSLAVQHLIACGIVQSYAQPRPGAGRKMEELKLNSEAGYFVAVDLEGTRVRFALTNFLGDVRRRWEEPLVFHRTLDICVFERGLDALLAGLRPAERSRVLAMGVSYPGTVDRSGRVTAVNLGWMDFPLAVRIRETVPIPAFLGNESRMKLLAECTLGVARGVRNCLYLEVANGVGASARVDGSYVEGRDGNAGELGHITIDPAAPDVCICGRRGCLEALSSSPNIVRQYAERTGGKREGLKGEDVVQVFERARNGDRDALAVVERAASALGLALAHMVNVLNPELIVLGGDIMQGADLVVPVIEKQLAANVLARMLPGVAVKCSTLGMDVGLIGAASLAFRGFLQDKELLRSVCGTPARRQKRRSRAPVEA